ncbi:MAG: undecaprenyldiphospho-muramoylpentapeptide beta-N-acetylglucosaminyltransferase [Parcubacteria group bacterium]
MRIVLTGGVSGGHIIPLIAVAKKIKEKNPEAEFLFIGPKKKMEEKLMSAAQIPIKGITTGKMRRYFSWLNFLDAFRIPWGIVQTLWLLLWYMPDVIFSKGGSSSLPVVLVGWLYRIPIMIHESDANPGLANSMLAKFSTRVAVSYPSAEVYFPEEQVVLTGSPLREDITQGEAQKAREKFSLTESKKVIFVWGGSQGAQAINNKILDILPDLLHKYQIIHQTGVANYETVIHLAAEYGIKAGREGYYPIAFIGEDLKDILAVSDIIISRAGNSSISEIAANGKPSIIIPIEHSANGHQRMNAYEVAKVGGCIVLEENNLGNNMLKAKIDEIADDGALSAKLGTNIKNFFYHPDAADRIAEGILGIIK